MGYRTGLMQTENEMSGARIDREHGKSNRETPLGGRTCAALAAGLRLRILKALALILLLPSVMAASTQDKPVELRRVLVLHSFRNAYPVNADWHRGIVRGFESASDLRIEIDIAAPDLTRLADADYLGNLFAIYRTKLGREQPDLIIPTYTPAFEFLLDHGEDRLPAGTQIRDRQLSIWNEFRKEIVTAVAVIVVQGLLIVMLLLNHRRLRRSRTALRGECDRRTDAEAVAAILRRRLAKFSKGRSLGTMATTIAHEISQSLTAIQNYAQAARRRLRSNVDPTPKLEELFEKIEEQVDRAGAITQHVRTLVSANDPELLRMNFYPVVEQVIRMIELEAQSRGCRITCASAADAPAVLADALNVQLVLVNLLQNAMQSICSEDQGDKRVCIDVRQINDREVQVSVADRGPGVPPERVDDIFDPLYSGRSEGLGMGLAICRDIVGAHGGRLWHEPNPGRGAIFRFTLRMAAA